MEDLKAYIETGILELYVLGDITPDEKLQVEAMALKHPEVKAELDAIELSMELYAKENAVEPSEKLRGRILGSLLINLGDDNNLTAAPKHEESTEYEEDNIVTLPARKENNFYKYAFAASFTLLIASSIALVNVYGNLKESKDQLIAITLDRQKIANNVNLMDKELIVLRDTSYKIIHLKGTAKTPASVITLAFSPAKKKVVLDMANMQMPKNDEAHQYQLWALVGGKPVDLGVFDAKGDTANIKEMKSIASADAFAVTLEPRGGSVNPTLDQMMVIGKF